MFVQAILAGLAMFIKDGLEAPIAQAETRQRGKLAGRLDMIKWLAEITTVTIAAGNIWSHGIVHSIPIIICVELGNYYGRSVGTLVGDRYIKDKNG